MRKVTLVLLVIIAVGILATGVILGYAVLIDRPTSVQQAPSPTSSSPTSPRTPNQTPPNSPSGLTADPSAEEVRLQWLDNSDNEDGFILYRDSTIIARLAPNSTIYTDSGLKPATIYQYRLTAYNDVGESNASSCSTKTLNPPIIVTLDKIGVYDNRETVMRGEDGEVYLYVVVSDGREITDRLRFPQQVGQHYKLSKNEIINIGTPIFSVNEVGDTLTLTLVSYEDDGGGLEPYIYEALGVAVKAQAGGSVGLLELFGISLSDLIGDVFGNDDDWLGSYERSWNSQNHWGVGKYEDIILKDERGVDCLRLWFTIQSP